MIEAVEAVKVPLESPAVDRRIKPKSSEESDQESFKFVPYVETTKPFEMSDFYKYSTKYKKSKNGSESSSTSSSNNDNNNTKPPELPAKNSPAKGKYQLKSLKKCSMNLIFFSFSFTDFSGQ